MKNTKINKKQLQEQKILQEIQLLKISWGKKILENLKNENIEEDNSNNKYLNRLYPVT